MVYSDLLSLTFSKSLRRALKKRWAHHSVREQKAYERSPFFCELHRASKKKEEDPCFLILIKKFRPLMSKDIQGNDWFGCFFSKLILSFHYYFLGTLMIVLSILFECQEKTATATYLSLSGCGVKCFLGRMRRGQKGDVNGIRRNLIQTH